MKKIFFSIFAAAALLTSCNMDEYPVGVLDDETAIESMQDAAKFRNGIYNNIRSISNGGYQYYPDMQADMFIGTQINGNRLGVVNLGSFNASTDDIESFWGNCYSWIAATNYFFEKIEPMLADPSLSDEDRVTLERYKGEAKFARAYYYWYLSNRFCPSYDKCNPDEAITGVPVVTVYNPTFDSSVYPGRNSLNETYAQIEADLKDAYDLLKDFEESGVEGATANLAPNANYLSSATVQALQARVALNKCDWATAAAKAESVINSGYFSLTTIEDFPLLWTADKGSELIFVAYGNQNQSGAVASIGEAWISANTDQADYVAAANALEMYDAWDDIRYEWFFEPRVLSVNGMKVTSPCFVKYPGNPALNKASKNELKNLGKPFRLAEQYLILAEASAQANNEAKANEALNTLRKNRIYDYEDQTYGGAVLMNEIRLERARELIGEGFRISDLRRWGLGFSRSDAYTDDYEDVPSILIPASVLTSYNAGDYRMIYPIPTGEIDANPNIAGQQNPGY